jgi:hypothetical protein
MNEHIKELARGVAYRFRQEGFKAVRRVPGRIMSELASVAPVPLQLEGAANSTHLPETQIAWSLPSSVVKISIESWDETAVADLNNEARCNSCDWLLLLPRGAETCHQGMGSLLALAEARPDAEIIYADEDFAEVGGTYASPRLKPDFNPELLMAQDYIGLPVLMRQRTFLALDGLRQGCGSAVLHDLWLRAWKHGCKFVRLPRVVLHNTTMRPLSNQADTLAVVSRFCCEQHPNHVARLGLTANSVQVVRKFDAHPEVTLVIPTCQSSCGDAAGPAEDPALPHILCLLKSIRRSSWPMGSLRVLIADDCDDGSVYESHNWPFRLDRIVTTRAPGERFSYARKMNVAWRRCETDAIILLNDDIRVRSPGWIEALMTFALDPEVGGVGARLLFPDGRLQHAGIVGGPHGTAVHAWFGQPAQQSTYQDWGLMHRGWSMVTGALFATRRTALEQVNGFDERFALEFNDLDLCLRLGLLGYRIVYTPFAELVHFEKSSRGAAQTPADELLRFRRRWRDVIADDPAYHPELTCHGYTISPSTFRT